MGSSHLTTMKLKFFLLPLILCLAPLFARGSGLTVSTSFGVQDHTMINNSTNKNGVFTGINTNAGIISGGGISNATFAGNSLVLLANPSSSEAQPFFQHYDGGNNDSFIIGHGGAEFFLGITNANTGEKAYIDGNINGEIEYNETVDPGQLGSAFHRFYITPTNGVSIKYFEIGTNAVWALRFSGNASGLSNLVTAPASGHTNIVMEKTDGSLILYDLAALLGLTGGGSGSVTSVGFTPSSGHSVSPSTITTSGTFVETRTADESFVKFGATNIGYLQVLTNAQVGGSLLSGGITTTNGFTNLAATASSSAYWDANRKLGSLPNPGTAAAWVQTNDGNGNLGYAQMLGAGVLNASSHVRLNASTNIESWENASGYTNLVTVPADTSHTNVVIEKRDGSMGTYDLATLLANGSGGGSVPNGLVTNAAAADITVTNAGAITTIRTNSVITPSVVVGGAVALAGASNTLSGTTYLGTNVAPYITADSGGSAYTTNTVYTGKAQRGLLVGSVMLNSGVTGSASMVLFYTNNNVGYALNMQAGSGVSVADFVPFCVPLSTNATFQFVPALGTGASCYVTNTFEWLQ